MNFQFKIILLFSFLSFAVLGQNIDTKHISLDLQFNWEKKQASGVAEITLKLLQTSDKIALDAGKLSIESIELNGVKLIFDYNDAVLHKNLVVKLDRLYSENEEITLKIHYRTNYINHSDPNAISGSFGKGLRFFQSTTTTPNKRKQIWSSGEPDSNKFWFPCNEDIADIHTTEIKVTLEKPLMLIANGELKNQTDNKDGTRTFHYKSKNPFPNYLVAIVVGEYVAIEQKVKGKSIHNFGYPHEKEAVKATVELLPDMLQFLEEKTGMAYPFQAYNQIVVQDYPFPGLVGQNNFSIISDNYIDDYGVHNDFKYLWDGVAMQALANQWFGNLLMPKSWEDIWLNNAFSQYFSGLYTAKSNAKEEYLTYYYPFEKTNVLGDWNAGNHHPIVPTQIDDLSSFTTDSYSKFKGALVLRMLHNELGDETFWKVIKHYVKTNANKQINTKDFQNSVEQISGESFQWFFNQWIYKIGLPKFEVTKDYHSATKQLILKVKQIQNQENKTKFEKVTYFQGKINIEIENRTESIYLKPQAESTFIFSEKENPKFINFNVEETFLCESIFEKSSEEYVNQLQFSKDVLAKQNALDKLVEVLKSETVSEMQKEKIKTTFISEFQSQQYWRYRLYVLGSLQKIFHLPYDNRFVELLEKTIKNEKSWIKASAITTLGKTNDATFKDIYIKALKDESDRVINASANALGKTKCSEAFEYLMNLEKQSSWKNQNRISALNGLQQLGDERAIDYVLKCLKDNQSPRWYLATPVWDYPFASVNTLVALRKAHLGYPILLNRFKKSLEEDDINDIFQNVQLINLLKLPEAEEIYPLLKEKFKSDVMVLESITNYHNQFLESIKK